MSIITKQKLNVGKVRNPDGSGFVSSRKCDCEPGFSEVWQKCVADTDDDDAFLDFDDTSDPTIESNLKVVSMATTLATPTTINVTESLMDKKIDHQVIYTYPDCIC